MATWSPPRPAVAELIRATVARLERQADAILAEFRAAMHEIADEEILEDPQLAAAFERSTVAVLGRWLESNAQRPGEPVAAEVGDEILDPTRNSVRRGIDPSPHEYYRVGQWIAWRHLMAAVSSQTQDATLMGETLDLLARSTAAYVNDVLAAVSEQIGRETAALADGTHVRRLDAARTILSSGEMTTDVASRRLGYQLDRPLLALVLWTEAADVALRDLEQVADDLARVVGRGSALTIADSVSSVWAWIPVEDAGPDRDALLRAAREHPGVRVATGLVGRGAAGFRHSHLTARTTQRLMDRHARSVPVATFDDVQLVALLGDDEVRSREFVTRTLGDLLTGDPALRETMHVAAREGFSTRRTAAALHTHPNTVLNRLKRAEELLPAPLDAHRIDVGVALELARWLVPSEPGG